VARARVEVELEEDVDARGGKRLARPGERRRHLGGMVAVVVVEVDAGRLAAPLEAAARAPELRQHRLGLGPFDAGKLERGQRRGRVAAVVLAADREGEADRLELAAAHDRRRGREPALEELL